MPLLGQLALWMAVLFAVWAVATGLGGRARAGGYAALAESARRASGALFVVLLVALVALELGLVRQDFHMVYVTAQSERSLSPVFRWAALLAGAEGQLLYWTAAVALGGAVAQRRGGPTVIVVVAAVVLCAAAVMLVLRNPFATLPYTPLDGNGLAPDFQDVGLLFYPPLLFAASAVAVILPALAVAELVDRHPAVEGAWRAWATLAWVLATAGMTVGLWWAYRRLGAEGGWVADPVRSGSLPGWLLLTALVHLEREGASVARRLRLGLMFAVGALAAWGMFGGAGRSASLVLSSVALTVLIGVIALVRGMPRVAARPRRLRRYAVRAMHGGLAAVAVAMLGSQFRAAAEQHVDPGGEVTVRAWGRRDYTFRYVALSRYPADNRVVAAALVEVRRGPRLVGRLVPELRQYVDIFGRDRFAPVSRAAVLAGPRDDIYAVLVSGSETSDRVVVRVAVTPFVSWIWVGGAVMVAGGILLLSIQRRDP